jgi:hypothetical protein
MKLLPTLRKPSVVKNVPFALIAAPHLNMTLLLTVPEVAQVPKGVTLAVDHYQRLVKPVASKIKTAPVEMLDFKMLDYEVARVDTLSKVCIF